MRFLVESGARQEWRSWVQHVETWTSSMIRREVERLQRQIANTPARHARMIENLQFALDHLLEVQRRRSSQRRTLQVSWRAKLMPRAVRQIRQFWRRGWTQQRLARHFRVSQASVHNLLAGKTYRNVK